MIERIKALFAELQGAHDLGAPDARVLEVMAGLPRHRFVPGVPAIACYADAPLAIGHSQTISQPFMVALMTGLLRLQPGDRVLEVGTGSGYQTAVLAALAAHVFSIETVPELAERAARVLDELGVDNVTTTVGDGHRGWPEQAPFDAILVTAAPAEVPAALIDQLRPGGRLVIPCGAPNDGDGQMLEVIEKSPDGAVQRTPKLAVRFVPLVVGQRC